MKFPILCLILLFAVVRTEDDNVEEAEDDGDVSAQKNVYDVNLDKFIDENQDGIKEALEAIDPIQSKDRKFTFIKFITISLREGWIQNLSLFHRAGNCSLKYNGKRLILDLTVGWEILAVDYKYYFKKMILPTMTGDLHMTVFDSSLNLVISFDFDSFKAYLDRVRIIGARKCDLKVEGSLADFITNILLQFFPRGTLIREIETMTRGLINEKLDYINGNLNETLASDNNPKMIQMFISSFKNFHKNTHANRV